MNRVSSFGSFVVLERGDFGEVSSRVGDICFDECGNLYIKGKKLLEYPSHEISVKGYPADSYSYPSFMQKIDAYKGESENLSYTTISDLLNNISLNEPAPVYFQHEEGIYPMSNQAYVDLPRKSWIKIQGKTFIKQGIDTILKELLTKLELDPHSLNRLIMLMTQASIARAFTTLFKRFSFIEKGIQILPHGCNCEEVEIQNQEIILKSIVYVSLQDLLEEPRQVLRYSKVIREFHIQKDELAKGVMHKSYAIDHFFPFYLTHLETIF